MGLNFGKKSEESDKNEQNESKPDAFIPLTDENPKGDRGKDDANVRTASDSTDDGKTENNTGPSAPSFEQQAKDAGVLSQSGAVRDPSAKDLGIDAEKIQQDDLVGKVMAENFAADRGVVPNESNDEVIFSSHPIENFQVGPYLFQNATLRLKADKSGEFEKLIEHLPPADRLIIKRIDVGAVDAIIQQREQLNRTTRGALDSGADRSAMELLRRTHPSVGSQVVGADMGFDSSQTHEGNAPVPQVPADDSDNHTPGGLASTDKSESQA